MNKIIINLIILFVLNICYVSAQNPDELKQSSTHIAIIGKPDQKGVHLRWAPTDFSIWIVASKQGFVLDRAVWTEDNYPLSKKKLEFKPIGRFKAMTLKEWEQQLGVQDTIAALAAQAFYGNEETRALKPGTMAAAKEIEELQSIRHAMGMLAADLSQNAAKGLGLYYYDTDVETDRDYVYRILIENTKANLGTDTAFIHINFSGIALSTPPVQNVQLEEKYGSVRIFWPRELNSDFFTAYHIERSADNKKFVRITPRPVTNAVGEDQGDVFEFNDLNVSFGKKYYYRISGITPFAENSPFSEVVEGSPAYYQGPPPPQDVKISQVGETFKLDWSIPNEHITKDLAGWIVKRSLAASGPFEPAHQEILPIKDRSFTDRNAAPIFNNYYQVYSIDKSGIETASFLVAGVWKDNIPPAVPLNVKATVDTTGKVMINWDENKEIDLQGYRVFVRDDEHKEWYQLTNFPVAENVFITTVDVRTLSKSIEYSVVALDFNYNASEFAKPFTLALPDLVAPVAPRWKSWQIANDQLELNWYTSASDDVKTQSFFVRTDGSNWQKIRDFDAGAAAWSYPLSSGIMHDFALMVYDHTGNSSDTLYLKNVKHTHAKKVEGVTDVRIQEANKEEGLELSWKYNGPENVRFYIFRKDLNSDDLEEFGSFDSPTRKIIDKGPSAFGSGFSYFIQTVMEDGINSEWSGPHVVRFKN